MFKQNAKFKTNQCRPTYVWTQIFEWRVQNIKSVFLILVLTVIFLGGLIAVPSVQAGQTLVTDHAKVEAFAFDGSGTVNPPVVSEGSDFFDFTDTVTIFDDLTNGRAAGSEATQSTTMDFDNIIVGIISTSGAAVANWQDADPGDGNDPAGEATSEFSVTFDLDSVTDFALSGSIDTAADGSNASCSSITVTSPSGSTFTVADPPGCGSPGQSIEETGTLQPGRYTFSIVANAVAGNPNANGGNAQASFELALVFGCTIVGTAGDDNLIGTNGDDVICGLGGENNINGLGGFDFIFGGPETDIIHGGSDVDFIFGEGGEDLLFGDDGDDRINGGGDADFIVGALGNDFLFGGPDNGGDIIYGDEEQNCARATSAPGLNDDEILGGGGNDELFGCQGLDKINGGAGDDLISGDKENDVLLGGPGSDKLRGKKGNDTLEGDEPGAPGPRKDVLVGGAGDDMFRARDGVKDSVKGGAGNDQAQTDSNDTVRGVEVSLP